MSQLKLTADSGGGTVAIKGPASTAGNAAIELTVPGTGSGTLAVGDTGKILQVLQDTKTDTATTNSTSFSAISGLSQAITTTGSNKVLVRVYLHFGLHGGNPVHFKLVRTTSGSDTDVLLGDADGNRTRATMGGLSASDTWNVNHESIEFLESPGAGTHTYSIHWKMISGYNPAYLNRSARDDNQNYASRTPSVITVMEVAA